MPGGATCRSPLLPAGAAEGQWQGQAGMMSGTMRDMHGGPGRVATGLAEMLSACFAVLI